MSACGNVSPWKEADAIMKNKEEKSEELKKSFHIESVQSEPCLRELSVKVPPEAVDREYEAVLGDVRKIALIPGFRPGKAPAQLVKRHLDPKIREEIVQRIFACLFDIIKEDKTEMLSFTLKDDKLPELKQGAPFEFKIVLNVAPEFKLPEYRTALKAEMPEVKIGQADVDKEIERFREVYGEFAKVEDAAREGDFLKACVETDFKPEAAETVKDKNLLGAAEAWLWLSHPESIPGLIAALAGATCGNEYSFSASFPADFREKCLSGKTVGYRIKVLEIQRRMPVASDEELCRRLKVDGVEALRADIEKKLKGDAAAKANAEIRNSVIAQLVSAAGEFPLPPALVASQTRTELSSIVDRIVRSKEDIGSFEKDKEKHLKAAKDNAERRLRLFFIMRKIAKDEKIEVGNDELEFYLKGMSRYYGVTKKELENRLEETGGIEDIKMDMLIRKVTDHLVKNLTGGAGKDVPPDAK